MKTLVVLALVLVAAAGVFLWRGRPALAAAEQAHTDLLRREHAIHAMERELPPDLAERLAELLAERDHLAALGRRRLALLTADTRREPAPELEALLAENRDRALAADARVGAALRVAEKRSPEARQAFTRILQALGPVRGVEVLELAGDGRPAPVPGAPGLVQVQAQLVLATSLPDALSVLERLAPEQGAGLPQLGVISASLRRIEPERWGTGLQHLDSPPVRLQVTLAVLLAAPAAEGA
jgi:hypothetical protein